MTQSLHLSLYNKWLVYLDITSMFSAQIVLIYFEYSGGTCDTKQ